MSTALEASTVAVKTMADGTLRLTVDFPPTSAQAAFMSGDGNRLAFHKHRDFTVPLVTLAQAEAMVAAERERWQKRVEEAFRDGYWARETYNDSEVSCADEEWARAKDGLFMA